MGAEDATAGVYTDPCPPGANRCVTRRLRDKRHRRESSGCTGRDPGHGPAVRGLPEGGKPRSYPKGAIRRSGGRSKGNPMQEKHYAQMLKEQSEPLPGC